MSENSVSNESEMQDAQTWGDAVDAATGTSADLSSELPNEIPLTGEIPPSAETPEMFTPTSSSLTRSSPERETIPDELRDFGWRSPCSLR